MNGGLSTFRSSLARRGWRATLLLSITYPHQIALRAIYRLRERRRVQKLKAGLRAFDERFGVETAIESTIAELGVASPNVQAHAYVAVSEENFTLAMATLEIPYEDFVFVDLGSGKGKALLLASEYPFRQIIGVELSPVMNRIAVENIARYRSPMQRCRQIESIHQDATKFEYPISPLVIFMYNPFGPDLLGSVLDRLERSLTDHPRLWVVVMLYPLWAQVVRDRGNFVESAGGEFFATFRYRADPRWHRATGEV